MPWLRRANWNERWLRYTGLPSRLGTAASIAIGILVGLLAGMAIVAAIWLIRNATASTWQAALQADASSEAPEHVRADAGANTGAVSAGAAQRQITGSPALDAALNARTAFERDRALYALASRASAQNAEALLRALGRRAGPSADSARAVLLQRLSDVDTDRALALLSELDAVLPGGREAQIALLFSSWGKRDFGGALTQLALLDGNDRNHAAEALLSVALERGDDLEALFARMPEGLSLQRLRSAAVWQQAQTDPGAAWAQARAWHDTEAMHSALRAWARSDAVAALAAAESEPAQTLRAALRDAVFAVWVSRDANAALNAALEAGLDQPGAAGFDSLMFKLGTDADAQSIENIVARLPAARRSAALNGLLAGATANEPERAWQVLRRLQLPDDVRARARLNALRQTAVTRPGYAIALSNSISDSAERDALLQALSEEFIASAPETAMQFIMEIDDRTLREALRTALAARRPGSTSPAAVAERNP